MRLAKKTLLRWLLAAGTVGALIGGAASAREPLCYRVYPCGCAPDGGYVYCSAYMDC